MELTLAESGSTLRSNVSNLEIDKQESEQLMSNPRLQQTVLPVTVLAWARPAPGSSRS